jgi:AcrR family transcriptional regulator
MTTFLENRCDSGPMTSDVGKREAHKIATRRAIQDAADALFAQEGYAATTVRDIAEAAGVTERTFFRYFAGKESLLVRDIEAWLPALAAEIRRRPVGEAPLDAIEVAFLELRDQVRASGSNLSWLFHDGPPGPRLEKSTPGLLLSFEQTVADALDDRSPEPIGSADRYANQVIARCAVAAFRSAGIRKWQLTQSGDGTPPDEIDLINQAFATLRRM